MIKSEGRALLKYITNTYLFQRENDIGLSISMQAILIDIYSLGSVIDFFNIYKKDISPKVHYYVIRNMSIIVYEICVFLNIKEVDDKSISESLKRIKKYRHKMKQFEPNDFKKRQMNIDSEMGRSRDKLKPHLDISLEFDLHYSYISSNIPFYDLNDKELQLDVYDMQKLIRLIQARFVDVSNDVLIKKNITYKTKLFPYTYTNILKHTKVDNERLLDRLVLGSDELGNCIYFFKHTIYLCEELKENPHILITFLKWISISYNQTFTNLNSFIIFSKSDTSDYLLIKKIIDKLSKDIIKFTGICRNNIHYNLQNDLSFANIDDLYRTLINLIEESIILKKEIDNLINIKANRWKLYGNRFLTWVQGNNVQ